MGSFIQVLTATESRADAERIGRTLVEDRLAGCVQIIGPITSIYRWQGRIETADEWLCLIKSRGELYGRIEERIRQLHPYETPEIVAFNMDAGSADYLSWLAAQTGAL